MSASKSDLKLLKRILPEVRGYRSLLALHWGISLLSSPIGLLTPLPLKLVVDSVLGNSPLPGFLIPILPAAASQSKSAILATSVVLMLLIAFVAQLQSWGSSLLYAYTGPRMVLGFQAKLFRHAQRLSISYHDQKGTADSVYRVQWDATALRYVVVDGILPLTTAVVFLAAMLWVTMRIDVQLALVALAISPVLFAASRISVRRLRSGWDQVKELDSASQSVVQEVLGVMRLVKAFGREDHEARRYLNYGKASVKAQARLAFIDASYTLCVGMTTAIGTALVLWISVRHIQAGLLTMGDLLLVIGYISQLYEPLSTIGTRAATLQGHLASLERAFVVLDELPDVVERPGACPIIRASGDVCFENVSFAYDGQYPALKQVSLKVTPGMRVGIHGKTGAGKTTLVSLLTRFYDVSGGRILLDGIDLRDYRIADLRNQFGMVLQDSVLFSSTISENIAYARPGAAEQEIVAAAKLADAYDFISQLPKGFDTLVGERGMRLSGGERQRISLARAFLKDAPILILDEPTSSVDNATEGAILDALDRLMQGRTTFMIAHRLSTLDTCDLRVEISGGRLVDRALTARI